MDIQKRIDNLSNYFYKMNMEGGFKNISIKIPQKWSIDATYATKHKVNINQSTEDETLFHFWGEDGEGVTFDNILDVIEYTIKSNEIAEEKIEILIKKVEELKILFSQTTDIEKLKNVSFTFDKKKAKKIIATVVSDENTPPPSSDENTAPISKEITNKEKE